MDIYSLQYVDKTLQTFTGFMVAGCTGLVPKASNKSLLGNTFTSPDMCWFLLIFFVAVVVVVMHYR